MKLKKLFSFAAAAVVAASALAASASADWEPVKKDDAKGGLDAKAANWLMPIFCNVETKDMPMTDYGIDLSQAKSVSFSFYVPDDQKEFFNGAFGGAVGVSWHINGLEKPTEVTEEMKTYEYPNGKKTDKWNYYNWWSGEYWGLRDNDAKNPDSYDIDGEYLEGELPTISSIAEDKYASIMTVAPYTYTIKCDFANPIIDNECKAEDVTDLRVFIQTWSGSMYKLPITRCVVFDTAGEPMIAFDGVGNKVETSADDKKTYELQPDPWELMDDTSDDASAPANSAADSTASTAASTPANSTATSTATSNATSAAANSTTSTASEPSGFPVGAIVGIAAGVVAVIVVVIVVVKKKKG
ncbi:MAG: hypothetical protein K2J80_02900 [Oscillospiraceae bacterium]|nr:hypothetical protein [Oscillospiraceae bacterium]